MPSADPPHPGEPQSTSWVPGRLTLLFAEKVSGCDLHSISIKVTFSFI